MTIEEAERQEAEAFDHLLAVIKDPGQTYDDFREVNRKWLESPRNLRKAINHQEEREPCSGR